MIIYILVTAHLLADFLFQSSAISERKRQERKALFLHCSIYFIVFEILFFMLFQCEKVFFPALIITLFHFFIIVLKNKLEKIFKQKRFQLLFFLLNQLINIVMIIGIYYIFNLENSTNYFYEKLQDYENFKLIILYILLFSIILDPASVFIRKLFISISPKDYQKNNFEELKAGNIIGKLERMIIAVLLLNNQFGVIGFVLTAKSIARFKQMEDRDFAEKYLIGTLTSLFIVLVTVLILKKILIE